MKLLLIWPKARTDPDWGGDLGAIAEPLALEYLATAAQSDGHEVRILDLRLHDGELGSTLRDFHPDVVGVTAFSMHVRAALAICLASKQLLPDCHTIVGGHHATFLPEDFFEASVDYVVSGEGTAPLREVLRRLSSAQGGPAIPGVSANLGDRFETSPPGALDLEQLPLPDRTITGADRRSYFIDWMKPVALLRTTVGCPYRCTFCSLWQLTAGRYHMRPVCDVADELLQIEEDYVFLVDDEAFIHRRRMAALAEEVARRGIRKRFFAYCRIDTLARNRSVVAQWKEIGLERLFVGIDAISPSGLAEYRKKVSVPQIEDGLRVAHELEIDVLAQFVINPDYSDRDFVRLRRFVEHHRLSYPSFTVLTPLPGTELLKDFDSVLPRQPNGRPDWDYFDTQNAVTKTLLPPDRFREQYRGLYRTFRGSYLEFMRYHAPSAEKTPSPAPYAATLTQ